MGAIDFTVGDQRGAVSVAFDQASRKVIFETSEPRATRREIPFDGTSVLPQGDRAMFVMEDQKVWSTPLPIQAVQGIFDRIAKLTP